MRMLLIVAGLAACSIIGGARVAGASLFVLAVLVVVWRNAG